MSKLPIGAVYQTVLDEMLAASVMNQVSTNSVQSKSNLSRASGGTLPPLPAAESGPISICVEGLLLWLLLVWVTAGTAAIFTLIVKSCRNRWKKIGEIDFEWDGPATIGRPKLQQHHSSILHPYSPSSYTRSTSASSTVASFQPVRKQSPIVSRPAIPPPAPPPPPPPPPPKPLVRPATGHHRSAHHHLAVSSRHDNILAHSRRTPRERSRSISGHRTRRLQSTQA